jgi:hypothetical protein
MYLNLLIRQGLSLRTESGVCVPLIQFEMEDEGDLNFQFEDWGAYHRPSQIPGGDWIIPNPFGKGLALCYSISITPKRVKGLEKGKRDYVARLKDVWRSPNLDVWPEEASVLKFICEQQRKN